MKNRIYKLFSLLITLSATICGVYAIGPVSPGFDFTKASDKSINSVVFIKVVTLEDNRMWDPFFGMFGNIDQVASSGSGVIISSDGFIITNNHVINKNQSIEVILNNNKRSFKAKVIGTDPSTDLALLKIESKNLPAIEFTNSDEAKVGEWVLAVGNPFNLTSSVTAGIVSAKGRNINIVQNQFPIESFIQTDAAINPGNSGGALVDLEGKLIGINTAILSKTGSYSGYGFAIPSNIVKKVYHDLKDFGYVQRAFIEGEIVDIDTRLAEKIEGDDLQGVYIKNIYPGGNIDVAGMKKGDIIIQIDNKKIDYRAEFDEQIAYHRPGDIINCIYKRSGVQNTTQLILKNDRGTAALEKTKSYRSTSLGADFEEISKIEKEKLKITNGIRVYNLKPGGVISRINLPDNYIIVAFNYKKFQNPEDLIKAIETTQGKIIFEGVNSNGQRAFFQSFVY